MHRGQQLRSRRPRPGHELGGPAGHRDRHAQRDRRGAARGDGRRRASRSAGDRSPGSWSSCSRRLARCRCTRTRIGTGPAGTSARRSARPRPGSCSTRRATAPSRRTPGSASSPGVERDWFADAVRRHDSKGIRGSLHRTDVHPGEVYVAHAGVPHYLGPRISFIEVQEPSDHIVIPETSGDDDAGATMGLGWDLALDMIDYTGTDAEQAFGRARQQPRVLRTSHGSREVRLFQDDVLPVLRRHRAGGGGRDRHRRRTLLRRGCGVGRLARSRVTSAASRSAAARRTRCPRACRSASGPGANRFASSAASVRRRASPHELQEVLDARRLAAASRVS